MTKAHRVTLLFLLALSLIYLIYTLAFPGAFYFDDHRPLSKLAFVDNFGSAMEFIRSEASGDLGRPLSMITFLLNLEDWPNNPSGFLQVNIFIHLINGVLVFILTHLLLRLIQLKATRATPHIQLIAVIAAVFWLALPIHTATNLISIQRMASFSSFFILMGCTVYLALLLKQSDLKSEIEGIVAKKTYLTQMSVLGLFTLLAMLAKENGVLLPTLVLILELTLLAHVKQISANRQLRIYTLALLFLLVLAALIWYSFKIGLTPEGRNFTLLERLASQPLILIEYVSLSFFPISEQINPFHDNYLQLNKTKLQFILGIVIVVSAVIFSCLTRKKYPLIAFAILWFVGAHLIESSVIPLEYFFLHRNYLPLVGPCIAIVVALANHSSKYKKALQVAFGFYLIFIFLSLVQTTSIWGDANRSSETWFMTQKGSARASGFLTEQLMKENKVKEAWLALELQIENCPSCLDNKLQAMILSCMLGQNQRTDELYQASIKQSSDGSPLYRSPSALPNAFYYLSNNQCSAIDAKQLIDLNINILENPHLLSNQHRQLYLNLFNLYHFEGQFDKAEENLISAWGEDHSHLTAYKLISFYEKQGELEKAHLFVNKEMCKHLPSRDILRKQAIARCDEAKLRYKETVH